MAIPIAREGAAAFKPPGLQKQLLSAVRPISAFKEFILETAKLVLFVKSVAHVS